MHLLCQNQAAWFILYLPPPPTQYITSHHTIHTPPNPPGVPPSARYGERWHHTQQPFSTYRTATYTCEMACCNTHPIPPACKIV